MARQRSSAEEAAAKADATSRTVASMLLFERSAVMRRLALAAGLIGLAVVFVLLTMHFTEQAQSHKFEGRINGLQGQVTGAVASAQQERADVEVLKKQLRDAQIKPAVPDRPPITVPPTTTTVRRTTTTARPATTSPTTSPTTTTTTPPRPPPPTTTTTVCNVKVDGLVCV